MKTVAEHLEGIREAVAEMVEEYPVTGTPGWMAFRDVHFALDDLEKDYARRKILENPEKSF